MKRLRPWLVPVLLVLAALVAAWSWNRASRLSDSLTRAKEESAAAAADLAVQVQAKQKEIAEAVEREASLAAQLEEARAAIPGVRVVEVVKWRTAQAPGAGTPLPSQQCPAGGQCPACLYAPGNPGEVRAADARLEGPAGARVIIAAAEFWRMGPGEPAKVYAGQIETPAPVALIEAERPPPRWGAGVAVYAGRDGWAAGPAVALPPLRLWGLQGEAVVGAGAGPTGAWQAGATAIVRW